MGKPTGFMEIERRDRGYLPVEKRVRNFREFVVPMPDEKVSEQGARCMDCGVPYCHTGCPVDNLIPDWNDLVYRGKWREAAEVLHSTNNFPEFTGRICPAPCEASCTLNITDVPVTIKTIECTIADKAWDHGWVTPDVPAHKTGRRVAVIGSGPAGMACAQQLARAGHGVTVFEKNAKIGGLLRYGIPDFKMEKHLIDRRIAQMQTEGVTFKPRIEVGRTLPVQNLIDGFDAVVLTGGAEKPRDLPVPGRELDGVHFAMDFLVQQNRRVGREPLGEVAELTAKDKHVVVIGGGDTGSDCIGTSFRQGAKSVTQIEIMPMPPHRENKGMTWPDWPMKMRTSSSQEEGAERDFAIKTVRLEGAEGKVRRLHAIRLDEKMQEIPDTGFVVDADLVLLAMGFVHPLHEGLLESLGVDLDARGNVRADTRDYATSQPKVFAAGDMRRGQSLVVWAIREGRQCAHAVDKFLMGRTLLPR